MIDNKTRIARINLCQRADTKYYTLVLRILFGLIPSERRVT